MALSAPRLARTGRLPIIFALALLLVAGGLADRRSGARSGRRRPTVRPMPLAAPASALSSSWFCAGASEQAPGVAEGYLIIANNADQPVQGMVRLIPSQGPSVLLPVEVGAKNRTIVAERAAGGAPLVGAIVNLDGGATAVEQQINGPLGLSATACATDGSSHWYVADGTTQENSTLWLSLLNPYPEDAIVDLSFTTDQGVEEPADFQAMVVPAGRLLGVDVGSHLRRRASIATTVTARTGRVVAFQTQVISAQVPPPPGSSSPPSAAGTAGPAPRPPGLSLVLGSPSVGTSWWWPDGVVSDGVTERYIVYNPGPTEADVSLAVELAQGSADPFSLKVAPGAVVTVDSSAEARIPKGIAHAALIRSTNGAGVVSERVVTATTPSTHTGLAEVLGSRLTARQWLLASGVATPSVDEWVDIYNPGPGSQRVSISQLGAGHLTGLSGLTGLTVAAHQRVAIRINDHNDSLDASLLVQANGDIVVERDLYPTKGAGLDATIGVPLDG